MGLRDDVALIAATPDQDQVVTADALVAGVHFFADDPPGSIARKCLGVNLSDLAAKGAAPQGFVMTMALVAGWTEEWLSAFAVGLGEYAEACRCPLLGGDTVRTPGPLMVSITAFGTVPRGAMVPRTGARAGDGLYVTGTIGDAALGLRLRLEPGSIDRRFEGPERDYLLDRYLHPRPRLALRQALLAHASGGMDISDGLVGDLRKMMHVSGVTAEVALHHVPLSTAAQRLIDRHPDLFDAAMTGGDDYEILASVPPAAERAFKNAALTVGVPVARIGEVGRGHEAPQFLDAYGDRRTFERGSFSHF